MMVPTPTGMKCRKCGFTKERDKSANSFVSTAERKEDDIAILEGSESAGLPTTTIKCPECGNRTAYWWMRQLRAADESEVRFFRCTECGATWREYD
jgi:DNA-directed RNA polymerase subunit M